MFIFVLHDATKRYREKPTVYDSENIISLLRACASSLYYYSVLLYSSTTCVVCTNAAAYGIVCVDHVFSISLFRIRKRACAQCLFGQIVWFRA